MAGVSTVSPKPWRRSFSSDMVCSHASASVASMKFQSTSPGKALGTSASRWTTRLQRPARGGMVSRSACGRGGAASMPKATATAGHTWLHENTSPLATLKSSSRAAGSVAAHSMARASRSAEV